MLSGRQRVSLNQRCFDTVWFLLIAFINPLRECNHQILRRVFGEMLYVEEHHICGFYLVGTPWPSLLRVFANNSM